MTRPDTAGRRLSDSARIGTGAGRVSDFNDVSLWRGETAASPASIAVGGSWRADSTRATLMLQAGVHPKVASERLGHHSVAFTLDVYAHVIPGKQSDAANRVAELFSDPSDGEPVSKP